MLYIWAWLVHAARLDVGHAGDHDVRAEVPEVLAGGPAAAAGGDWRVAITDNFEASIWARPPLFSG